jgi:hypothetical protein
MAGHGRKRKYEHEETGVKRVCDCGDCPGTKPLTPRAIRLHWQNKRQRLDEAGDFKSSVRAESDDDCSGDDDSDVSESNVDCLVDQRLDTKADAPADSSSDSDDSAADDDKPAEAKKRGRPKIDIDLNASLFEGSATKLLHVIEAFFEVQQRHKVSESCMVDLFDVVSAILPPDNVMVQYAAAKREALKQGAPQLVEVDCCVNDCVLFRDANILFDTDRRRQLASAVSCPVCGEARRNGTSPRKVAFVCARPAFLTCVVQFCLQRFLWLPLIPQLKQLYKRPGNSAKLRIPPDTGPKSVLASLMDSPGYRKAVYSTGFDAEPRNLLLALSADGVNPHRKTQHSMWQICATVLCPDDDVRQNNLLLFGVVPGPKAPQSLNAFLDLCVDELLEMDLGVPATDCDAKRPDFTLRARLLFTMGDYPGK